MVKLKFIGHRILIFAIIAAIVNVYAFEYWCNVRLAAMAAAHSPAPQLHSHSHPDQTHTHSASRYADHGQAKGSEHAHSASHHHSEADKPATEKGAGCCKDETANFFSSLQAPALTKCHIAPLDLPTLFPVWLASFHLASPQDWQQSWPFHPDVGLRPKIPDIRIFLCSLTI